MSVKAGTAQASCTLPGLLLRGGANQRRQVGSSGDNPLADRVQRQAHCLFCTGTEAAGTEIGRYSGLDAVTTTLVDVVEVEVEVAVEAPPQPALIGAIAKTSHAYLAK